MAIDRNQTFIDGELVHEEVVEVPDRGPSPEERIAQLEAQIAALLAAQHDG